MINIMLYSLTNRITKLQDTIPMTKAALPSKRLRKRKKLLSLIYMCEDFCILKNILFYSVVYHYCNIIFHLSIHFSL